MAPWPEIEPTRLIRQETLPPNLGPFRPQRLVNYVRVNLPPLTQNRKACHGRLSASCPYLPTTVAGGI
jgi:hypothetical protein